MDNDRDQQTVRYRAGAHLFRPGEPCAGFLMVRQGTIRVSLLAANGREIVLYRVRPGEICLQTFACLVSDERYSAEGVAETDIEADLVPRSAFGERVARDPGFRQQVFGAVARRFHDFEQLVEDVALSGFDVRLARALLKLADDQGCVRATHEALAVETGSGRAVVSRQLAEFARRGLVVPGRSEVRIVDAGGLRHICAG